MSRTDRTKACSAPVAFGTVAVMPARHKLRGELAAATAYVALAGSCAASVRDGAEGQRAPRSRLSAGSVLVYGVGHRDGSVSFIVSSDGTARYQERNSAAGEKQVSAAVTPDELKALAVVLRRNRFCSLESKRLEGVPDEARPSISVRIEEIDCEVELWDNEFHDDPQALACLRAVEALARTVEQRAE